MKMSARFATWSLVSKTDLRYYLCCIAGLRHRIPTHLSDFFVASDLAEQLAGAPTPNVFPNSLTSSTSPIAQRRHVRLQVGGCVELQPLPSRENILLVEGVIVSQSTGTSSAYVIQ